MNQPLGPDTWIFSDALHKMCRTLSFDSADMEYDKYVTFITPIFSKQTDILSILNSVKRITQ